MMRPIMGGSAYLRYSNKVNLICDGNSLTQGHGDGVPWPTQIVGLSPLNTAVVITNTAISGQSTELMTSNRADVNAAYVTGKINVLTLWEGINSINNGDSARQAADAMWACVAANLGDHPDYYIMLFNAPPRQLGGTEAADIAFNAVVDQYNILLLNEYKSKGVKLFCDIRGPGSFLNLPDYTRASFNASAAQGWWAAAEVGTNNLTHYSTKGQGGIANIVSKRLKFMPAR